MKKVFMVLVLALIIAGGVFAQDAKNWISGEVSILGAGARYERMLTPKFSLGADVYWTSLFFFWNDFGANAVGRFYPWAGKFYTELGLGLGVHTGLTAMTGVDIVPGLGWKIDVGKKGGFFIEPGIQVPITLGVDQYWGGFGAGVGVRAYLGLGGAF
jgi:hypothetical protein